MEPLLLKLPFRLASFIALFAVSIAAVACGTAEGSQPTATSMGGMLLNTPAASPEDTLSVTVMTPLDVSVSTTRLPFAVFLSDADQTRLDDRLADLSFSFRHQDDASFQPLTQVEWRGWPTNGGAYVAHPQFDRAGIWEFRVELTEDGGHKRVGSTFVQVKEKSSAPEIGAPAPASVTKTASTVEEVRQISSALDPDPDFYSISLDKAITSGKPTIVLFSTPAYCTTGVCGPQLDTLGQVKDIYKDRINFIHVEIYDNIREMLDTGNQSIGELSQAVKDWGLVSEPWTFFIDSNGTVVDRFEQYTTFEELNEAVQRLLEQG